MLSPLNWTERKRERQTIQRTFLCVFPLVTKFLRKTEILSTAPNEKSQVEFLMAWSNRGKKNKGIFYSRLSSLQTLERRRFQQVSL